MCTASQQAQEAVAKRCLEHTEEWVCKERRWYQLTCVQSPNKRRKLPLKGVSRNWGEGFVKREDGMILRV